MLNSDISCFENSEAPDQLAFEKPADQELHCFGSAHKYRQPIESYKFNGKIMGRSINHRAS